ncbi:LysR family transcriptional regulator [Variovorax beijingensis]|uniref:LysR family transcriptional regulator n=1 Tax=Variovorax beijingensis TaxID=2496117 RepID=A0ABY0A631_9BURK|nr:LysR family transcriptional regulator [Variovorax beijingensis]RSZ35583.1 LysR family transcriptional regulator [Variovorax beijingensis]
MLTHRQLRYFVEIVDAGSFSLAAERLFIAQSALSRQVREMERELQAALLERDTRHMEMTAAGRSLYTDARRILAVLEDAAARASHAQRGTEGTLQLLHSSSVPLNAPILALVQQHSEQHPGVSIEVSQASSEHQALDVHEGRADVGLARAHILRRFGDVHYVPLYEEPLVAVVPAGHAMAGRASVPLDALRHERFVATPHLERGGLSHRVAELCRAQGFQPLAASVRSRKWAQLALVQGGFGIAVVPESMARLAPAGVCLLPLEGGDCTTGVLALWRRDAPALVQRFADALQASLGAKVGESS